MKARVVRKVCGRRAGQKWKRQRFASTFPLRPELAVGLVQQKAFLCRSAVQFGGGIICGGAEQQEQPGRLQAGQGRDALQQGVLLACTHGYVLPAGWGRGATRSGRPRMHVSSERSTNAAGEFIKCWLGGVALLPALSLECVLVRLSTHNAGPPVKIRQRQTSGRTASNINMACVEMWSQASTASAESREVREFMPENVARRRL